MGKKTLYLDTVEKVKNFVDLITPYPYEIDVCSGRFVVNAKSILGIFSLDTSQPVEVVIHAEDCAALLERLEPYAF